MVYLSHLFSMKSIDISRLDGNSHYKQMAVRFTQYSYFEYF